jgi:RNA polymerase sigma-70 factor (ECF subfamily)
LDRQREQALVNAAKHGDAEAFTALYHAYADLVYRHLYYRTFRREVAEDLTADVFVRILEGLPSYEERDIPFMVWVYRIAHARLVDYYRRGRQRYEHQDVDTLQMSIEHSLDDALSATQEAELVQKALRYLSPHQQQVIILRFIEGHNLATTAQILGITVGAVKAAQFKAIQRLSQLLKSSTKPNEQTGLMGESI